MPIFSVIMPVYQVEAFVAEAIASVLAQSISDFELIIVDDCGGDNSVAICKSFCDARIKVVHHKTNRGLAGARNTGIRHAKGRYLAFIDSDDCWHPEKLKKHFDHLESHPEVGVSFSRSAFIDEQSRALNCYQMPTLKNIEPNLLLCRNPVGNGSAPVIRRRVLKDIEFQIDEHDAPLNCYFDESFRRSEDIECWLRIALTTNWKIEGIPEPLTLYRVNAGGLSANLYQQYESWQVLVEKTKSYAPEFTARYEHRARAYQLRYLARQAIRLADGKEAVKLWHNALAEDWKILLEEPARSTVTAVAAYVLRWTPKLFARIESVGVKCVGWMQKQKINRDLAVE